MDIPDEVSEFVRGADVTGVVCAAIVRAAPRSPLGYAASRYPNDLQRLLSLTRRAQATLTRGNTSLAITQFDDAAKAAQAIKFGLKTSDDMVNEIFRAAVEICGTARTITELIERLARMAMQYVKDSGGNPANINPARLRDELVASKTAASRVHV